jgi:hypothetical protein
MGEVAKAVNGSALLGAGVYLLYLAGEVVYVGKSKCLLNRIYAHHYRQRYRDRPHVTDPAEGIEFDGLEFVACRPSRLDELETALIKLYSPRHNIQHNQITIAEIVNDILTTLPQPPPQPRMFKCRPLA